jgi:hypothetical protein
LSSGYFEADFDEALNFHGIIRHMSIEGGGSGQGINPDVPQASDTQPNKSQPKKRDRTAYLSEYNKKYYEQNREKELERKRKQYQQNPQPILERNRKRAEENFDQGREYQREYYLKNREQISERKSEYNRRKREAKGK